MVLQHKCDWSDINSKQNKSRVGLQNSILFQEVSGQKWEVASETLLHRWWLCVHTTPPGWQNWKGLTTILRIWVRFTAQEEKFLHQTSPAVLRTWPFGPKNMGRQWCFMSWKEEIDPSVWELSDWLNSGSSDLVSNWSVPGQRQGEARHCPLD